MSNYIIDAVRENDYLHDPWGAAIDVAFACCDGLTVAGIAAPIDSYRPAPSIVPTGHATWRDWGYYLIDHPTAGRDVASAILNGDAASVLYAARVLDRYLDVVRAAGRDY